MRRCTPSKDVTSELVFAADCYSIFLEVKGNVVSADAMKAASCSSLTVARCLEERNLLPSRDRKPCVL